MSTNVHLRVLDIGIQHVLRHKQPKMHQLMRIRMNKDSVGLEIPGLTPCTLFARKPASYIDQAVTSGQPLLLIRRNRVLVAIVPIESPGELLQYLQIQPAAQEEGS